MHIAVDKIAHEIVADELSLSNVTDAEVIFNLLKQTRRKIIEKSGDDGYDTRNCHDAIRIKRAVALIPPREGLHFGSKGTLAGCEKLYRTNKKWKKRNDYRKRLPSETVMYRVKQLLGGKLNLRNYNAQVDVTYAMIKAVNKLTGLGLTETHRID